MAKKPQKAKPQKAKPDPEAERLKKERDRQAAAAKKKARSDYDRLLADAKAAKRMTDLPAWQAFYRKLTERKAEHARQILIAEKTRDVVRHQEGSKLIGELVQDVKEPVNALNRFIRETPLFCGANCLRAVFNESLGTIRLVPVG